MFLIGTDEAGYGPNLGPLVVSATLWQLESNPRSVDLYRRLDDVVRPSAADSRDGRVAWADSKVLYKPAGGLALLERGLLAAIGLIGSRPTNWHELWSLLDPTSVDWLAAVPWHVDYGAALPVAADVEDLDRLIPRLQAGFARAGVRLLAIRCRAVFPEQFNRLTDEHGNKAEALSRLTLELVAEMLARIPAGEVRVECDKHGGRNRYGPLLQRQFRDTLVEVRREGRAESRYRFGPAEQRVEISFRAGGERWLPAALASMASKYLRELSMKAFNSFWRQRVPHLRPTAGYPVDARRFKSEIQSAQTALGIDDRTLWRAR